MSEWGSILDALEAEFRTAIPTLPTGTLGFEQGDGLGNDLKESQLPHIYTRPILEASESTLGYGVQTVSIIMTFSLWTSKSTVEQVAALLDGIRTGIAANRTLGGLVEKAEMSARQHGGENDRGVRNAEFIVQAEVWR